MADNLTDLSELRLLDWVNVVGTPARPTAPLKVALVTVNGTESAAGTEVAPGANAYARQSVTFTAAAAGSASNTALLQWTNMPAVTVVGLEVWDSAPTPVRLWFGPLTAAKTLSAGDTFELPVGALATGLN